MRTIAIGIGLSCIAMPSLALMDDKFTLLRFHAETLYTAEKQILDLAMRNPVSTKADVQGDGPMNPHGRFIACRVSSPSRGVTLVPDFCEVTGGQYPITVDACRNITTTEKSAIGRNCSEEAAPLIM